MLRCDRIPVMLNLLTGVDLSPCDGLPLNRLFSAYFLKGSVVTVE